MTATQKKFSLILLTAVLTLLLVAYMENGLNYSQKKYQISETLTPLNTLQMKSSTPSPVNTVTTIQTVTITQTSLKTNITFSATPTIRPTSTSTANPYDYPESFYITDINGHRQVYALGCEAANAVDWANYFGVLIYEYDFQFSLPRSDNPDIGFVGDVHSDWGQIPPYAYGVHAGPVADLLQTHGLPAKSVNNYTLDEVKQKLSESKPVIAWVIGNMEYSKATEYIDKEGRSATVAPYEHVVMLTGYDETSIRYMTNGRFIDTPAEVFLKSWGVLGNMAIVYEDENLHMNPR